MPCSFIEPKPRFLKAPADFDSDKDAKTSRHDRVTCLVVIRKRLRPLVAACSAVHQARCAVRAGDEQGQRDAADDQQQRQAGHEVRVYHKPSQ